MYPTKRSGEDIEMKAIEGTCGGSIDPELKCQEGWMPVMNKQKIPLQISCFLRGNRVVQDGA